MLCPNHRVPGVVESTAGIYNKQKCYVHVPFDGCHVACTLNLCYDLIYLTDKVSEIFVQTVYIPLWI